MSQVSNCLLVMQGATRINPVHRAEWLRQRPRCHTEWAQSHHLLLQESTTDPTTIKDLRFSFFHCQSEFAIHLQEVQQIRNLELIASRFWKTH